MMFAPEQINLAHDLALSVGIAVLLYAFIVRPAVLALAHLLRQSSRRKVTNNDQTVRVSEGSGGQTFISQDEHEEAIAEAFRRGYQTHQLIAQRGHLYAVGSPVAEIVKFPTNGNAAS